MIKLNTESKIYVLCPANKETGGTELAHQLVDVLRNNDRDAIIIYECNKKFVEANVPKSFQKYNIKSTILIEDSINNILILPEVSFAHVTKFQKIQFAFWWMSVDNYYKYGTISDTFKFYNLITTLKIIYSRIKRREKLFSNISIHKLKKLQCRSIHLYQSAYAREHLINNGFMEILPLSDYINTQFLGKNNNSLKANIILYNPAKGLKFTKEIIKSLPGYIFKPIKNLSRSELLIYLQTAKLYIDFGNHPGKDRLPREAAINGCCVITGKKGAAYYFEDIPIYASYKFKNSKKLIPEIKNKIEYVISNYENCLKDFEFYKKRILLEKEKFYREVEELFF